VSEAGLKFAPSGYVNIAPRLKEVGKKTDHFWRAKSTREVAEAVAAELGMSVSELRIARKGGQLGDQGTCLHPRLIPHFERWCKSLVRITPSPSPGDVFGHWRVIGTVARDSRGKGRVTAACVCGTVKDLDANSLKSGGTDSCGCRPRVRPMRIQPERIVWRGMMQRCYLRTTRFYKNYGGRGITVCERWHTFECFLADMGARPSPAHEIDRIDNDRGYEPGNCRWVLAKVNCRNRRSNRYIKAFGETRTLAEWAEIRGLNASTIAYRMDRMGMTAEQAMATPKSKNQFR
jgi:hypothetical protein